MKLSPAPATAHWRWTFSPAPPQVHARRVTRSARESGAECEFTCNALAVAQQIFTSASNRCDAGTANKSNQPSSKPMLTKPPECWSTDPNAHALKVEVSADQSVLLPFEHLLFAELTSHPDAQELQLSFVTHEVIVKGTCLRKIEAALQRKDLAHLAVTIHSNGRSLEDAQPTIRQIAVSRIDVSGSSSQDADDGNKSPAMGE